MKLMALAIFPIAIAGMSVKAESAPGGGRHVVVTHGIDSDGGDLKMLINALKRTGFAVHLFVYVPSDGSLGLEKPAEDLAKFVERELPADTRFSLVAFSMGGLITRWYLDILGGAARVERYVTISSPHNGSLMANLRWNLGGEQLRPGSDFLRTLESNNGPVQSGKIEAYSFWTPLDLMILPANSSVVPWAKEHMFWVAAHPLMLTDKDVLKTLCEILARPPRNGRAAAPSAAL
jgi:triacylglycerol lipase